MTEDFKRGLITGLAMQPLVVAGVPPAAKLPQPVIELRLDGNIKNTGTGKYAVTTYGNDAIQYAPGRNGKMCFAATNHCRIDITDMSALLAADFTVTGWLKIADDGIAPYNQYRRIIAWSVSSTYRGFEIGYTNYGTTNCPSFVATGGIAGATAQSAIADDDWHSFALVQRGDNITVTIDMTDVITWYRCSLSAPGQSIMLSSNDYSLNGYLSDIRIFDRALNFVEQEGILATI